MELEHARRAGLGDADQAVGDRHALRRACAQLSRFARRHRSAAGLRPAPRCQGHPARLRAPDPRPHGRFRRLGLRAHGPLRAAPDRFRHGSGRDPPCRRATIPAAAPAATTSTPRARTAPSIRPCPRLAQDEPVPRSAAASGRDPRLGGGAGLAAAYFLRPRAENEHARLQRRQRVAGIMGGGNGEDWDREAPHLRERPLARYPERDRGLPFGA